MEYFGKIIKSLSLFLLCSILISFLWGPLIPWSPVKIGYQKIQGNYCTVYYLNRYTPEDAYNKCDGYLEEISDIFDLQIKRNVTVIVTDKTHLQRYVFWMNIKEAGGLSFQTGDLVYINKEKLLEKQQALGPYIKHELTHALEHQFSGFFNAVFAKQNWINEGTATYIGMQGLYDSEDEFLSEYDPINTSIVTNKVSKLYYNYYRKFIEYLINKHSLETFSTFLHGYLKDPYKYQIIFQDVFGASPQEEEILFKKQLNSD